MRIRGGVRAIDSQWQGKRNMSVKIMIKKYFKKWIISAAVLTVVMIPLVFILMTNSDAFRLAASYIKSHQAISAALGPIQDVSFSYLGSNSLGFTSLEGGGDFELKVKGANQSGLVHVVLEKKFYAWQVTDATFYQVGKAPTILKKSQQK